MRVLTVAVRGTDGAIFQVDKTGIKKLKQIAGSGSTVTDGGKWRHIVKQMNKHRRPCRVRLLVGYKDDVPVFEEMIYRPGGTVLDEFVVDGDNK